MDINHELLWLKSTVSLKEQIHPLQCMHNNCFMLANWIQFVFLSELSFLGKNLLL